MKDQTINITVGPSQDARLLARVALRVIERRAAESADHLDGGDVRSAAETLGMMTSQLVTLLAPYAGGGRYAGVMPKTVIILRNGNSLQVPTTTNSAADIAGLMNAGTPSVYQGTDVNDGLLHHIRVSEILDVYEVP